jgi:transposase IS116/IS110/IS902 family protein
VVRERGSDPGVPVLVRTSDGRLPETGLREQGRALSRVLGGSAPPTPLSGPGRIWSARGWRWPTSCAQSWSVWPGPIGLFRDLDSPISLAFLARYPSPTDARGLGEKRLQAFLKGQRYNNRKTAAELLGRLRSAPAGRGGEAETRARRSVVAGLVATLQSMVGQIIELESEIAEALDAHPDREIFRSFFRSRDSVISPATLLGEIGDCRARYPHRDAIAADGGQAPVAQESGKRKHANFRWACNKRLRNALGTLAHSTRIWNPWAADRYASARQRGHNHRRALRTLGRAWSRIIWRCWQDRTRYDPQRHTGLQQHVTVTIPTPSGPRPDLAAAQRMAGAAVTRRAARRAERASA